MRIGEPNPSTFPERSLNEGEILEFLKKHNINPSTLSDLMRINNLEKVSLLFVLPMGIQDDDGPYKNLPRQDRPSIVRIDNPAHIQLTPAREAVPENLARGGRVYSLFNSKDQMDYFVIGQDGKVRCTRTTRNERTYYVTLDRIFAADDSLFPKSEGK